MPTNPYFQNFLQTIGTNLHILRLSQKLTIQTVAKAVSMSSRTLRQVEKGEHDMRLESLFRLLLFYKVTLRDVTTAKKPYWD